MEEALELSDFLPLSYKTKSEEEYIRFLWEAFQSNYMNEKYEFASLAFHLLYMSYIGFSIWQIRLAREDDFRKALVGFQLTSENKLLSADTPFKFYESMKESQIFRFLKLIGCANNDVGEFAKFVSRRNKIAHPSGAVFFNDQVQFDTEIRDMIKKVTNIEKLMMPVVMEIYRDFLLDSSDPERREYADPRQELEVNLVHKNYVSQEDIKICLRFDVDGLSSHYHYGYMCELHDFLKIEYGTGIAEGK